ncbi:MAG TPA: ACP S-malonyltransferase [Verrucomicrobiales bacterium]|jgi:[acyl-carrier-protein] S-malonyltransferase|nr:ACP S-malonyltransferase [Verrucomicrobiales bacterium]
MPPVTLLFSGQGAQAVGMGRELAAAFPAARALFDQADATLDFSLTNVMFDGPMDELTRTSRCQPALYAHGLACLAVLREQAPELEIRAAAGLSLGEFTAHAAAGTFDFETGLKLVARRGLFMEEACQATQGSMIAMLGGEGEQIRQLANDADVDMANFNTPGQIVLSGTKEGIARVAVLAKERGLRGKELPVAGAYHSRLMRSAQDKLAAELAHTQMTTPRFPVVCNLEARPVSSPEDIRRTLENQVTGSVRWAQSMDFLLNEGHTHFLELGPGGQLSGMLGRIRKGTSVWSITDPASLEKALEALRG